MINHNWKSERDDGGDRWPIQLPAPSSKLRIVSPISSAPFNSIYLRMPGSQPSDFWAGSVVSESFQLGLVQLTWVVSPSVGWLAGWRFSYFHLRLFVSLGACSFSWPFWSHALVSAFLECVDVGFVLEVLLRWAFEFLAKTKLQICWNVDSAIITHLESGNN